jgi:putative acetyltransferase
MSHQIEWETTFRAKNGKPLRFRPEKASDTEMLWAMFSTLSEASVSNLIPPFTRERIEGWTSNIDFSKVLAIVAVTEDKNKPRIVASASLKFHSEEVFNHKVELGITVHDDYQNLGIGTALLSHLLGIARQKGLKKVYLIVNTENAKAIALYKKAGFEVEGTLRREMHLNGKYIDEYRMALFL